MTVLLEELRYLLHKQSAHFYTCFTNDLWYVTCIVGDIITIGVLNLVYGKGDKKWVLNAEWTAETVEVSQPFARSFFALTLYISSTINWTRKVVAALSQALIFFCFLVAVVWYIGVFLPWTHDTTKRKSCRSHHFLAFRNIQWINSNQEPRNWKRSMSNERPFQNKKQKLLLTYLWTGLFCYTDYDSETS